MPRVSAADGLAELLDRQLSVASRRQLLALGVKDAWWPRAGVVAEVDSRAWHLSPEHWS